MPSAGQSGISPGFVVPSSNLRLRHFFSVTLVDIDGVQPPVLGPDDGHSEAMNIINQWFPWIDEKLVPPKYDGVCQYLGVPSNRPTYIKDYHILSLFRAVDFLLQPRFRAHLQVRTGSSGPLPPPTS